MRKEFISLVCALSLTSCFYEAMYHISEKDKKWIEPYCQDDTILFRSGDDMDTMTIVEKGVADRIIPLVESEASSIFYGTASIDFTLKHKGRVIYPGWLIVVKESDNVLSLSTRIDNRQFKVTDTRHVKYSAKQIGRTVFKDIIHVDSTNSELFSYDEYTPRSFSWSKSKGLLQYVYPNGETYTFYKIITHDSMSEPNDKQTRFDRLLDEIKEIIDRL